MILSFLKKKKFLFKFFLSTPPDIENPYGLYILYVNNNKNKPIPILHA